MQSHHPSNRFHWGTAFLLSLVVAAIYASPLLVLKLQGFRLFYPAYRITPNQEQVLHDGTMCDHLPYFSLAREALDNGFPVREGYTLEGKDAPLRPQTGDLNLLGLVIRLVGGLDRSRIFCAFVFPLLISLAFYLLCFEVLGRWKESLLATAIAMFGMYPTMRIVWSQTTDFVVINGVGPYERVPYPQISAVWFFLFLWGLYRIFKGSRDWWLITLTSGLLGILAYSYFYYFIFALTVSMICLLVMLAKSETSDRPARLGLGILIAVMLILPSLYLLSQMPGELRSDYAFRQTLILSNHPWLQTIIPQTKAAAALHFLALGGFFLLWAECRQFRCYKPIIFITVCLFSASLLENHQILTRVTIDPAHYYYRCFKPFLAILISLLYIKCISLFRFQKLVNMALMIVPFLFLVYSATYVQSEYVKQYQNRYNLDSDYENSLEWLNWHTPKDSVVLAGIGTSSIIPVYTHNNVLIRHGKELGTNQDILNRLASWCAIWNIPESTIRSQLSTIYSQQYFLDGTPWFFYPHMRDYEKIEHWLQSVIERSGQIECEEILKTYQVDYILAGPEEQENGLVPEAINCFNVKSCATFGEYAIYRILPDESSPVNPVP